MYILYIYIYLSQSHFLIIVASGNSLPTCDSMWQPELIVIDLFRPIQSNI